MEALEKGQTHCPERLYFNPRELKQQNKDNDERQVHQEEDV